MSTNTPLVERPADWGLDPILNPDFEPLDLNQATPRLARVGEAVAPMRFIKMADTIKGSLGVLPGGWDAYASYIDNFGGYNDLVAAKEATGAFLLSITIFGGKARCADVEPGGMRPADLPNWLDHVGLTDGSPSWVYTSAGNMALCNQFIGNRHVIRWSAHYGHGWHICGPSTCGWPQADITQCFDKGLGGENYDRSLGFAYVVPPTVTHPSAPHGVASAALHFDLAADAWTVSGTPGGVQPATEDRWASAEVQYNVQSGQWRLAPLPWNAEPLGQ